METETWIILTVIVVVFSSSLMSISTMSTMTAGGAWVYGKQGQNKKQTRGSLTGKTVVPVAATTHVPVQAPVAAPAPAPAPASTPVPLPTPNKDPSTGGGLGGGSGTGTGGGQVPGAYDDGSIGAPVIGVNPIPKPAPVAGGSGTVNGDSQQVTTWRSVSGIQSILAPGQVPITMMSEIYSIPEAQVPEIRADEYLDAVFGPGRRQLNIKSRIIQGPDVSVIFGPGLDTQNSDQVRAIYKSAIQALRQIQMISGLSKKRLIVYLSGTGLQKPEDIEGNNIAAWSDIEGNVNLVYKGWSASVLSHEICHVFTFAFITGVPVSGMIAESLVSFLAAIMTNDVYLYNNIPEFVCARRNENFWSRGRISDMVTGTPYHMIAFWLFIAQEYGVEAFRDLIWGSKKVLTKYNNNQGDSLWVIVAAALGEKDTVSLAAKWLQSLLTLSLFTKKMEDRNRAKTNIVDNKSTKYYTTSLKWRWALPVNELVISTADIARRSNVQVKTQKGSLEPYGFEVFDVGTLAQNISSTGKLTCSLRIDSAEHQGKGRWLCFLIKRNEDKISEALTSSRSDITIEILASDLGSGVLLVVMPVGIDEVSKSNDQVRYHIDVNY